MSTQAIIDEVMKLSGPFTSAKATDRHRHWLGAQTTEWLLRRRLELNESAQRPGGQRDLAWDR